MRFRKRPVEIEAERVDDLLRYFLTGVDAVPSWFLVAHQGGYLMLFPDHIKIETLEGVMRAERDDWIIRGIHGELYPCKPDIFAKTYEAIPDAQPREEVNCDG